jgi:hypothetical protein
LNDTIQRGVEGVESALKFARGERIGIEFRHAGAQYVLSLLYATYSAAICCLVFVFHM